MAKQIVYKYGPIPFFNEKFRNDRVVATVEGNPVHAGFQDNKIFVWSIVAHGSNPEHRITRKMVFYPTGVEYKGEYWFTVIDQNGFVWHIIEERNA
jgi:hypothetical protein